MGSISFSAWLLLELDSAMLSLMTVIEKRENMRYVEADAIKSAYMEKIGNFEKEVLASELDATLMKKKSELIRACLNRREPVDMQKIDKMIEAEKEKQIRSVEENALNCSPRAAVPGKQAEEMQKMYKEIIRCFHPEINHGMTETQKEAYEKAVAAYKSQCFETLKLAYDMLFKDRSELSLQPENAAETSERSAEEAADEITEILEADYTVAAELFEFFKPLENDRIIKETTDGYIEKIRTVEEEIEKMRAEFPFSAVETLKDPEKTREYIDSLKFRLQRSEEEIAAFNREITAMTGAD